MSHYEAARQVGSRSHSFLVGMAGGMFEACHETAGADLAMAILKIGGAAFITGFMYAIGAALSAMIVARWRKP